MSVHENTDNMDKSSSSASEIISKSVEEISNQKQQDPIDFRIVTQIPEKHCKFQWTIKQFSTLERHKALYSTSIRVLPNSFRLKFVKYEHGFGLFHERERSEKTQSEVQSGVSFADVPQSGVQFANVPQSGVSFADVPQSGVSFADVPQSGVQFADVPQSGVSFADVPQSGFSFGKTPQSGVSFADVPQSGFSFGKTPSNEIPAFSVGAVPQPDFKIGTVSLSGKSTTVSNKKAVSKVQENKNDFSPKLEYQVSATDARGKQLVKWSACFSNYDQSLSCEIGGYLNNGSDNYPDDLLILHCNLKAILKPSTQEIPIAYGPSLEDSGWKKLSTDLKALYENSLHADVILKVETDKIHAHKSILAARSPIFKKLFQHDMKEAEQNSVVITDVEFPALQRLIEFLYTGGITDVGNTDMDLQELYDLYYAADKYEVMDLREMVGNSMLKKIQEDNAIEILVWFDRHNEKDLKFRVINFICINFETVSGTDTWESCILHHPKLAADVIDFHVKKLKNIEK